MELFQRVKLKDGRVGIVVDQTEQKDYIVDLGNTMEQYNAVVVNFDEIEELITE